MDSSRPSHRERPLLDIAAKHEKLYGQSQLHCTIGIKTFLFDWGKAGEPAVVGVCSLAPKSLINKVNAVFEALRSQYFLMWTYFTFDGFHFVL